MNERRLKARQAETEFLTGFEANVEQAKGSGLPGTFWQTTSFDESSRVHALVGKLGGGDRALMAEMPQNRRTVISGYERRWWGGKRRTGLAIASVLTPLEAYIRDDDAEAPPPIELDALARHVREIAIAEKVPQLIGVCSPSGFSPEALGARLELPGVTLVLVEPREDGGWTVHGSSGAESPGASGIDAVGRLFDPEATSKKLARVVAEIERRSADLLGSGINVRDLAEALDVPTNTVLLGCERARRVDPELNVTRQGNDILLYRGAPVSTTKEAPMSMVDRIRQLFGVEGNEAKKVNALTENRLALSKRRDRIYEDIAKLEKKEHELVEEGKATKSTVTRKRIAAQVGQLRKEINRHSTSAAMLNQQINVISTHVHNLTLTQQGEMAKLPAAEELTEIAVQAEEMLETLKADADLVDTLDMGVADSLASDDELAILAEFEASDPAETESGERATGAQRAEADGTSPERAAEKKQRGEPEAT
jgi:hypothetical protein